jgi:hypothetical protein
MIIAFSPDGSQFAYFAPIADTINVIEVKEIVKLTDSIKNSIVTSFKGSERFVKNCVESFKFIKQMSFVNNDFIVVKGDAVIMTINLTQKKVRSFSLDLLIYEKIMAFRFNLF